IGGLISSSVSVANIMVAEPDQQQRSRLQLQFAVHTTADNSDTLSADVVILAVKPQLLQIVCRALSETLKQSGRQPLFISIAAGVRSDDIDRWLGGNRVIVRAMPNTPSLLASGATGLYANPRVSAAQMAGHSKLDVATLRAQVTSKGGTTEQAINHFQQAGFEPLVEKAMQAAYDRSRTLANELGKDQS
nr:NAD(P)-binding domain-containing protein [Gammaproteobacteria bacterium]